MSQPEDQPPAGAMPGGPGQPSEEEMRAALDQQMREIRVEDLLIQSVASLLNLSARRIAKEDERDLDQARLGIDAVRAVTDLLPEEAASQVRNALSELQMLYAQTAGSGGEGESGGGDEGDEGDDGPAGGGGEPPRPPTPPPPGPAAPGRTQPPPKLWTPGGSG